MLYVTLTPAQRDDLLEGQAVLVTLDDGAVARVTPYLVAHATDALASGGEIVILPRVLDDNRLEEVTLR